MRSFFDKAATVKRLATVGEKSTYSSVGTVEGFLKPLDSEQSALNDIQFGQGFRFIAEQGEDIIATDILTVDSVDYTVKGVADNPTSAGYLDVILEKPIKN